MIRYYYHLTKPGIIYGNAITAAAGFFLASRGDINYSLLIIALLGISLVMASGCVFNNYIDRDIDALMERTKNRELVLGIIAPQNALYFGGFLGAAGLLILNIFTNSLVFLVSLIALFLYVVAYSLWTKRKTVFGTLVGAIPGALPPVIGYVAVTGKIDLAVTILFLILVFWQMTHFYSIAIYRLKDYTAAKISVLPVVKGIYATKFHIIFWVLAFIVAVHQLHYYHYSGDMYLKIMTLLGLTWLSFSIAGFWTKDNQKWAKNMFIFSIIILLVFSVLISMNF